MIWAINKGIKIRATPKGKGFCPLCEEEVIAKCGQINIWHWAHKSGFECDSFGEPETEWHLNWKANFPKECQEFIMGRHRADVRTKSRWIIEFQNSPISPIEIKDREEYYKKMIWLFNGEKFAKGLELRDKKGIITFRWKNPPKSLWEAKKDIYLDLKFKINELNKKIKETKDKDEIFKQISEESVNEYTGETYWTSEYYDAKPFILKKLNSQLKLIKEKGTIFKINKIYKKIPCGGWGELISKDKFLKKFK